MGTITIVESHVITGGSNDSATATVVAGFLPDATMAPPVCTKTVAGCEIPLTADCAGTTGCPIECSSWCHN
jgi:hypothetical protein